MLEMLKPSVGDAMRFAANVIKVRSELNRAWKADRNAARALIVDRFCSPPASARRAPTVARLRDDATRYFGWKPAHWAQHEQRLQRLVQSAQTSTVVHEGLQVQCYGWQPVGKPRGRMLLSHGWEGYAHNFALLADKAVHAGFEVHSFDHLAHGASQGTRSGLSTVLQTLLTVAKHVCREHGAIDVLVGHSLGGAAASWAAAHGKVQAQRLVLLAPFYDTLALSKKWAKAHLLSDELREGLQYELERTSGLTFAEFMPDALAPAFAKRSGLEVLVIHDRKDALTSFDHSASLATLAPRVTLRDAKGLGHIAILADDDCMAHAVEFAAAG
jgi:pimeloyl-ACP methyl ester carboxylesterase